MRTVSEVNTLKEALENCKIENEDWKKYVEGLIE
jgi:hypothetical protein